MFQLMNTREDISTFVQANNPGAYTSPVKSFHKPEESQLLVRSTTFFNVGLPCSFAIINYSETSSDPLEIRKVSV